MSNVRLKLLVNGRTRLDRTVDDEVLSRTIRLIRRALEAHLGDQHRVVLTTSINGDEGVVTIAWAPGPKNGSKPH